MAVHFRSFADIFAHLDGLGLFHVDLRLERMHGALAALGLARPPFSVAQVLGTNGKGSTSTFLASLCQAHGCTVGLYTSPHFVSPTERIVVNGQPLPEADWVNAANRVMTASPELTYFEFLTVLAVVLFVEHRVDVAVLEAGLGGHHDATTAIACDCCCFTPIALDHTDILGPTIEAIADDKAHAIRSAAPVFTAQQEPAVAAILADRARAFHAPLTVVPPLAPRAHALGLAGAHQLGNAALALAAWGFLADRLGKPAHDTKAIAQGLRCAFVPGRLQYVPATSAPASSGRPPLLLDGAHNPHGTRSLVQYLTTAHIQPCACVYSCLHDKDWQPSVTMLADALGDVPLFVPAIDNPRAEQPEAVAAFWQGRGPVCTTQGPDAVAEALRMAAAKYISGNGPVLVCGSLYLLAEVFARHPECLRNSN